MNRNDIVVGGIYKMVNKEKCQWQSPKHPWDNMSKVLVVGVTLGWDNVQFIDAYGKHWYTFGLWQFRQFMKRIA